MKAFWLARFRYFIFPIFAPEFIYVLITPRTCTINFVTNVTFFKNDGKSLGYIEDNSSNLREYVHNGLVDLVEDEIIPTPIPMEVYFDSPFKFVNLYFVHVFCNLHVGAPQKKIGGSPCINLSNFT